MLLLLVVPTTCAEAPCGGKKSDPRRSTAAGRENLQSKAADPGRKNVAYNGNPIEKCCVITMEIRRRPGKSTIQIRRPGLTRADPPPPAEKIYNPNPLVLVLLLLVLLLSSPHGKAGSAGKTLRRPLYFGAHQT